MAVGQPAQPTPLTAHPFVVVNPIARHASSAIAEIVRQCRTFGIPTPQSLATTPEEPGSSQARQAIEAGADLVIAIGGDGTVRQVVRELAGTDVRLGIIALGSGNVLAHNLGLTGLDMPGQIAVALSGPTAVLDVGWARLVKADGQVLDEPFLTMAGIGRDAQAIASTDRTAKMRLGWAAYALQGLAHAAHPPLPMRVQMDDLPGHDVDTWTVLAGITPTVPGGVTIYPDTQADDGFLDILEVPIRHPGQWVAVAVKGILHPRLPVSVLRYQKARRLRVRPIDPLPVQLDGDVVANVASLDARLRPRSLRVHVPAESA